MKKKIFDMKKKRNSAKTATNKQIFILAPPIFLITHAQLGSTSICVPCVLYLLIVRTCTCTIYTEAFLL